MNRRGKDEALEASLKQSIVVNSLSKEANLCRSLSSQNAAIKPNSRKPKTANSKLVKATQSLHKGKASLIQFPVQNVLFGVEQNFPVKKTDGKKLTTLEFIDKLKKIEAKVENPDFLEQANEEIDIASRQLEEIRNMISEKLEKEAEQKEREFQKQQKAFREKCNKQFERMQQTYLNKTKMRFKSLQDVENMTLPKENKNKNVETVNKTSSRNSILNATSSQNFEKYLRNTDPLLKAQITSAVSEPPVVSIYKPKVRNEKPLNESKPASQKVRFQESILKSAYYSPTSSESLSPKPSSEKLDIENINRLLSLQMEDERELKQEAFQAFKYRTQRRLDKIDECSMTENFSSTNEKYHEGRRKLNLLLYGKEKVNNKEFDDAKLEDSVLKSEFLTKEFCKF